MENTSEHMKTFCTQTDTWGELWVTYTLSFSLFHGGQEDSHGKNPAPHLHSLGTQRTNIAFHDIWRFGGALQNIQLIEEYLHLKTFGKNIFSIHAGQSLNCLVFVLSTLAPPHFLMSPGHISLWVVTILSEELPPSHSYFLFIPIEFPVCAWSCHFPVQLRPISRLFLSICWW